MDVCEFGLPIYLHLKNRIIPYLRSIFSGFTLCVQACLAALGLITCVCALQLAHSSASRTQWVVSHALQKL